jgi:hypothetical protein
MHQLSAMVTVVPRVDAVLLLHQIAVVLFGLMPSCAASLPLHHNDCWQHADLVWLQLTQSAAQHFFDADHTWVVVHTRPPP